MALLLSPLIGFTLAALLLLAAKRLIRDPQPYRAPLGLARRRRGSAASSSSPAPASASAHGSNDGQRASAW